MKRVLVWGMAKSGIAAARLLAKKGYFVRINDLKTAEQLGGDLKDLEGLDLDVRLGEDVMPLLDDIDTLIISPGIPADHKAAVAARAKGICVIGEIELAYQFAKGMLVGVTGTNGKTTTTTLLGEMFRAAGKNTAVVGNIGEPYAAHADQLDEDSATVCELSSFQLETIETFRPNVSLILNLTEDHLNRHKTMENYGRIKERIFMNQAEGDSVVLNYDDPVTRAMSEHAKCAVTWFSRTQVPPKGAYVRDGFAVFSDGRTETSVINVDQIGIPGKHNLENALAAIAGAVTAGVPVCVVEKVLREFHGVEHRIETVRTVNGITYINDSKGTNPDSTIKAVETMKAETVILLGGSEKNSDYSAMCRIIKNSKVRFAVLLGDTGLNIGRALAAEGFTDMVYTGYDFKKAIDTASEHTQPGWNVLLSPACASFDMFRDFEHRGEEFKRIVNEL